MLYIVPMHDQALHCHWAMAAPPFSPFVLRGTTLTFCSFSAHAPTHARGAISHSEHSLLEGGYVTDDEPSDLPDDVPKRTAHIDIPPMTSPTGDVVVRLGSPSALFLGKREQACEKKGKGAIKDEGNERRTRRKGKKNKKKHLLHDVPPTILV